MNRAELARQMLDRYGTHWLAVGGPTLRLLAPGSPPSPAELSAGEVNRVEDVLEFRRELVQRDGQRIQRIVCEGAIIDERPANDKSPPSR